MGKWKFRGCRDLGEVLWTLSISPKFWVKNQNIWDSIIQYIVNLGIVPSGLLNQLSLISYTWVTWGSCTTCSTAPSAVLRLMSMSGNWCCSSHTEYVSKNETLRCSKALWQSTAIAPICRWYWFLVVFLVPMPNSFPENLREMLVASCNLCGSSAYQQEINLKPWKTSFCTFWPMHPRIQ